MSKYRNFGNVFSMGSNSVVQNGRSCTVNGKTIKVPNNATVSVANGKVYINGKEYKEDGMDKLEVVHVTIQSEGVVKRVESDVDVVVEGNVNGRIEAGVNVTVSGNVDGDIDAGVNATVKGSQTGSVDAGVNVMIGQKIYK